MRRKLAILAVLGLVISLPAAAADPILRLITQDASTVTLGWDPVSGAEGFRFSRAGSEQRSHTWDGARTQVRFAKADSYMVERIDTSVVGVYPGPPDPPPPPPGDRANVWVDSDGGSCARAATAVVYADATACGSFVAGYAAASSGDTVGVTGSLGTQKFAGGFQSSQPRGTKTLLFRGSLGNKVRQVHFGSPNLTFDGIHVDGGMQPGQAGAGLENGGEPFVFRNGSIGNVLDEKGALVTEQGIVFDNVRFHDVVLRGQGVHLECIMALWPDDMVIRNSRFENCGIMDISVGIADWWGSFPPPYDSVVLEGNWFGTSRVDNGACCAVYSVALWSTKLPSGSDFGQLNNWRIRNNYVEPGSDVIVRPTLGSGNVICGNTGNAPASWRVAC
jgi:hypothetical protein